MALKSSGATAHLCSQGGLSSDLSALSSKTSLLFWLPEPELCLGLCFYLPSLAFLPAFISSCFGSSETTSHSCPLHALSGPYPHPSPLCHQPAGNRRSLEPAPLLSLSPLLPFLCPGLFVACHLASHPHPIPVLKAVDPGLTVTPGSWLVRKVNSPPQPRLEPDTLRVKVSDLFTQALQMTLSKLRPSVVDHNKMALH